MYAPHNVTLFNAVENDDYSIDYYVTALEGVFLDTSKGNNISNNGAASSDSVTLFIPFGVTAHDRDTGIDKVYYPPKEFHALADKSGAWTLETANDTSSVCCYFAKGIIDETMDYGSLRKLVSDVYDVSTVRTLDFGSKDMQHWQVYAK